MGDEGTDGLEGEISSAHKAKVMPRSRRNTKEPWSTVCLDKSRIYGSVDFYALFAEAEEEAAGKAFSIIS